MVLAGHTKILVTVRCARAYIRALGKLEIGPLFLHSLPSPERTGVAPWSPDLLHGPLAAIKNHTGYLFSANFIDRRLHLDIGHFAVRHH